MTTPNTGIHVDNGGAILHPSTWELYWVLGTGLVLKKVNTYATMIDFFSFFLSLRILNPCGFENKAQIF
jgi:hypothetical protein